MADFTILRFNDCNRTLLAGISCHKQWLFLWGAAVLLLFWNLGTGAFSPLECTAAVAAQDYMLNPDIMPEKNRFLVRLIWLFSSPVRFVTETTARMPAAMGALFVLGAVITIAHKLAGRSAAIASGWFCLTLTGFLSAGRMVTAEMTLCALTLWTTAIYLYSREKFTCLSSILFWLLTAFAFYSGGIFALVPVLFMIFDCSLNTRTCNLYNWRNLTGLLVGIGSYFLFNYFCDFRCTDFGISLSTGFSRIVGMSLPWLPLIVLAFFDIVKRRKVGNDFRLLFYWFLITAFSTFFLKNTALPLLGICAILCGVMMTAAAMTIPQLISKLLFRLVDALMPLAAAILLITPFLFMWLGPRYLVHGMAYPNWFVAVFYFGAPLTGVLIFIWQSLMLRRKKQKKSLPEICGVDPVPDRVIPVTAFVLLALYAIIFPAAASDGAFASRKPFLKQTKLLLQKQYGMKAPQCIYLLPGDAVAECKMYLRTDDSSLPVKILSDRADYEKLKNQSGGALIGTRDDFARYRIDLDGIVLNEPLTLSDKAAKTENKLAVLLFLK